jgi:hypothetical protein
MGIELIAFGSIDNATCYKVPSFIGQLKLPLDLAGPSGAELFDIFTIVSTLDLDGGNPREIPPCRAIVLAHEKTSNLCWIGMRQAFNEFAKP